jgi:hypothetical protein
MTVKYRVDVVYYVLNQLLFLGKGQKCRTMNNDFYAVLVCTGERGLCQSNMSGESKEQKNEGLIVYLLKNTHNFHTFSMCMIEELS